MAYVSIVRVAVKPGSDAALEPAVREFLRARQALRARGDLVSTQMVRTADGAEYALVSVWTSRAAHEGNEDSPAEQAALQQLAPYLAGPPTEFAGEVIAELR